VTYGRTMVVCCLPPIYITDKHDITEISSLKVVLNSKSYIYLISKLFLNDSGLTTTPRDHVWYLWTSCFPIFSETTRLILINIWYPMVNYACCSITGSIYMKTVVWWLFCNWSVFISFHRNITTLKFSYWLSAPDWTCI
jgi:hypothetical protein